jgi:SAM-dependent methyltransferase
MDCEVLIHNQIAAMAEDPLKSTLRAMRDDWDRRARGNARYYIATGRADWTDEEFFASGEQEVAGQILNDMENVCQARNPASMRVLEIGCGAGRITRALARIFGEVHAVDISGEMIAQARTALSGQRNVFLYQNNGMDLSVVPDRPFDFAFSVIVFQHIPSRDVIESYFREVARLLRPGALFKVQVQRRPGPPDLPTPPAPRELPLRWRLTGRIPLPIRKRFLRPIRGLFLPKPESNSWVGATLTPDDAQALCDKAGFELRYRHSVTGEGYWLWCFKK